MVISAMTDITKHERRSKFLQPRDKTVVLNLSAFDGTHSQFDILAAEWMIMVCKPVEGSCTSRGGLDGQNKFKINITYIIDDQEVTYILK